MLVGTFQAVSHRVYEMNPALGYSDFVNCSYSGGTVEHFLFLQHCVLAGGSHYCQLTAPRPCPPNTTAPTGGSLQLQGGVGF